MSDMKCPFCGQEMICAGTICHYNPDCPIHDEPVPTEVLELLDRTRKALDYKAETIALSGKLEIATKALKSAQDHNNRMLKVLGEEVAEESTDDEECCWIENCSLKQELKQALEQIKHKDENNG